MMVLYHNNQKLIYASILTLFLIFTSYQYSLAQPESERADEINQDSKGSQLVCEFVQFCSTRVGSALYGTETSVITRVTPQNEVQSKAESTELLPDVTSNISLIMTPNLPSNLVSKDFQRITNEPLQVQNESIDTVSNSLIQNISNNDTLIGLKTILTNEINSESYSTNESSSTLTNNNTRPSPDENLANIEEDSWKNFTSTDGYSLSYPAEWNLTTYENEVYMEANQLDSYYYPKMTISIRDLDLSRLNNSILLEYILPIDNVPSETINMLLNDTKVMSNIGLKYYIDLDYIVLEPTQEGKYIIDRKEASVFKVHKIGNNYVNEHIIVINDDKIYSIEINSDYFSSSEEANQIKQIKEDVLKSIKWINNDTKSITDESRRTEIDSNSNTFDEESKDGFVLPSDVTDDNEIIKTITPSESDLNITSSTHFFDGDDFKVVGEVLNKGPNNRELVKVIITLYDDKSNVVGTELTYTNPSDLLSQQSAPFEVIIGKGDVSNTSAIKSYKLYLTSDVKASSNSDAQSSPISNTTTLTPLDKLMNLFNNKNSTIVSDPLSNNLGNSRPIENTNLVPTKTTDEMMADVSIVPGASLLSDTAYSPNPINLDVGSTIQWTNENTAFHTVTSGLIGDADAGKLFDSSLTGPTALTNKGKTFEYKFDTAGEYPYFCILHPFMVGQIIVK